MRSKYRRNCPHLVSKNQTGPIVQTWTLTLKDIPHNFVPICTFKAQNSKVSVCLVHYCIYLCVWPTQRCWDCRCPRQFVFHMEAKAEDFWWKLSMILVRKCQVLGCCQILQNWMLPLEARRQFAALQVMLISSTSLARHIFPILCHCTVEL